MQSAGKWKITVLTVVAGARVRGARERGGRGAGPHARRLRRHDDLLVPYGRDPDLSRAEHQSLRRDQDLPERAGRQRPGRHQRLRAGLEGRGLRHPLQAEHGRGPRGRHDCPRRASGTSTCTTSSGSGRRRADLRLRRGEDDGQPSAGLRDQGRRRRELEPQRHDSQPERRRAGARSTSRGRSTGCRRRLRPAPTSTRPTSSGSTSPGSRRSIPVFDAERGFDSNGDGEYVFPDEVPTDPSVPGYEERENISHGEELDRPSRRADARLRRRPPASGWPARRHRGRARRRRRAATSTATIPPRSGSCSGPTPGTTSRPAR